MTTNILDLAAQMLGHGFASTMKAAFPDHRLYGGEASRFGIKHHSGGAGDGVYRNATHSFETQKLFLNASGTKGREKVTHFERACGHGCVSLTDQSGRSAAAAALALGGLRGLWVWHANAVTRSSDHRFELHGRG